MTNVGVDAMQVLQCKNGVINITPQGLAHLEAHPEVLALLPKAAARITLPASGEFLAVSVDMRRVVGLSGCVVATTVGPQGPALFAQRVGRLGASRVTMAGGAPTQHVTVLAAGEGNGDYTLVSAWVGG